MKRKKVISVIMIIIGACLIVSGIFFSIFNDNKKANTNNENNNNQGTVNDPEVENNQEIDTNIGNVYEDVTVDYDTAYNIALSLYGEEGTIIELKEDSNKYTIYVKDTSGNIKNTFNMDKKTGAIEEEAKEFIME